MILLEILRGQLPTAEPSVPVWHDDDDCISGISHPVVSALLGVF